MQEKERQEDRRVTVQTEDWHGYPCQKLEFEGHEAFLVFPKVRPNGYLAVKTEYWNAFPHAVEIPLLEKGFHLCYIRNDNRWGTDPDLDRKARFVRSLQKECGLKNQCVPVGMSCGGLIAIKFAAKYPDLVRCLYLDAPVVNYMSCPCGFGVGRPLSADNSEILNALGMESISELLAYREMPLDRLPVLVEKRIPVVMVAGDSDTVVPFCENGVFLQRAYEQAGIDLEVYIKPGCDHHPHGLEEPEPVVKFILRYCDRINHIDQAIYESEQELSNGAEAVDTELVFAELEKKHFG